MIGEQPDYNILDKFIEIYDIKHKDTWDLINEID